MAAFHNRFKKSSIADTPPQSSDAAKDSKAQQAAMVKKKFDTFHAKYQNSPPSSDDSPRRESSSNAAKADAIDSLPLIEQKSPMSSGPSKSTAAYDPRHQHGPRSVEPPLHYETTYTSSKSSKPPKVKKTSKADAEAIKAQFAAIHSRYQNGPSHPDATPFRRSSNSTSSLRSSNSEAHQQGQTPASNLGRAPVRSSYDMRSAERSQRPRPPEPTPLDNGTDDRAKHRLSSMFTRSKPPKSSKTESLMTPLEEEEEKVVTQGMERLNSTARPNTKRDLVMRSSGTYEPPPLFQAYPQAVKHTTLPAPILSADAILRDRKNRKASFDNSLNEDVSRKGGRDNQFLQALHQDTDGDHWTRHEYVLVTSSYLLQYSAEGAHDRLPEKTLQLSKDSVAFVSDALPGKLYVLQVSTDTEEDGLPKQQTSAKSMFKKMGFRSESTKRAVSSFLLVFGTPEEMEAWIIAVKKEIENLGGKPYQPDSHGEARKGEESSGVVNGQNSRYYTIATPLQRFASLDRKPDTTKNRDHMSTIGFRRQTTEKTSRSGSRATTKGDVTILEQPALAYSGMVSSIEETNNEESGISTTNATTSRSINATAGQQHKIQLPKLDFSEVIWGDGPKSTADRSAQEDKETETYFTPATSNSNQRNAFFPHPPPAASASDSRKASVASSTSTSSGFVLRCPKSTSLLTPEDRRKSIPNFNKRYTIISNSEGPSEAPSAASSRRSSRISTTTSRNSNLSSATCPPQLTSQLPSSNLVAPPPPKRHSSLAYFHGVPPAVTPLLLPPEVSAKLPAPMPPPTRDLPAVPRSRSAVALRNRRSWYIGNPDTIDELEVQRSVSEAVVNKGMDEVGNKGTSTPTDGEGVAGTEVAAENIKNIVKGDGTHVRSMEDSSKRKSNRLRKRQPLPPAKPPEQRRHSSYDVNEAPWQRDYPQQHIEKVVEGEKWQQSQAQYQIHRPARDPPLRRASTLMQLRSFMAGNEI